MRWQYLSLIFASVASASNAARFNEMGNTHKEFTNELNSRQLTSDSCDCSGTKPNSTTGVGYICHDRRLGPTCLPRIWPLLSLVSDYNRFGRLTPGEFLKKWTYPEGSIDSSTNKPNAGKWHYPEHDGFQLDINNKSMAGDMTLLPGTLVDRFGYESGTFLSTADTPYSQRSLPPQSLDNPDQRSTEFPSNYHVYKVNKTLTVLGGPIAPGFEQPGLGIQFDTNKTGEVRGDIASLVTKGFLLPVNLSTIVIGPGKGGSCGL